ncbi:MAG: response regulator [Propionivibrio sp.]
MTPHASHAPHVYIVDDDDAIRDALGWLFKTRGVSQQSFASAEDFLAHWSPELCGCILLDMRMSGMSGNELFDLLRERGNTLPVIFLTGHGDVPMAVAALKNGAYDFVEKPCNDNELVDRVLEALRLDAEQRVDAAHADSFKRRSERLSTRERQVMDLVLQGKLNKNIADELQISIRTVEVHRSSVFEKMGVRTAVELARIVSASEGKNRG